MVMKNNFWNGFEKKASFKRMLLHSIMTGKPLRMKGHSRKSIFRTSVGKSTR